MSKLFLQILFIAVCIFALCQAEAPRSRSARFNAARRQGFLARQEAEAPAAVTPYPSADELKPEVPFSEGGSETAQPDEVYGPPEVEADDEAAFAADEEAAIAADEEAAAAAEEEAAAAAAEAEAEAPAQDFQPDEVYGPPELEVAEDDHFAPEPVTEEPRSGRLIFGRRVSGRRAARPAKLQASLTTAQRQRRQQQQLRERFVAQPVFVYQHLV